MAKGLGTYRQSLSPAQIADGINAARDNASRLAGDARLLLDSDRFPTAASIAALSIEESGKVSVLREVALARNPAELKAAWKKYSRHTAKNTAYILPDLIASGARSLDDLAPIFDAASDHPTLLDQVKQLGFYTDCLGEAHWSIPGKVIDASLATMLVVRAELFAKADVATAREIELWIEHVGPVWKRDVTWMKQGLRQWYQAMRDEGLSTRDEQSIDRFLNGPRDSDA